MEELKLYRVTRMCGSCAAQDEDEALASCPDEAKSVLDKMCWCCGDIPAVAGELMAVEKKTQPNSGQDQKPAE